MSTRSEPGGGQPDPGRDAIMSERRQLISLTYRLLGSLNALIALLDPGATATVDGGGLARVVPRPIEGAEQIARFYTDLAISGLTILERTVNGQPSLVAERDGTTIAVYAFDIADDRIRHIWTMQPDRPPHARSTGYAQCAAGWSAWPGPGSARSRNNRGLPESGGRILGSMGRIIGTILGVILAIWVAVTAAGGVFATVRRFLIIGLIVLAVVIVVRFLARRRGTDAGPPANGAGGPAGGDHET